MVQTTVRRLSILFTYTIGLSILKGRVLEGRLPTLT